MPKKVGTFFSIVIWGNFRATFIFQKALTEVEFRDILTVVEKRQTLSSEEGGRVKTPNLAEDLS